MGNTIQHHVPDGFFTRAELCKLTDTSRTTICRWLRDGLLEPEQFITLGRTRIGLYDRESIRRVKALRQRRRRK